MIRSQSRHATGAQPFPGATAARTFTLALGAALFAAPSALADVEVSALRALEAPEGTALVRTESGASVLTVEGAATDARLLTFDGGERVVLWTAADGGVRYRLAIRGEGEGFSRVRVAESLLHMRRGIWDPVFHELPPAPEGLQASGNLHIVQFVTQPIEAYRDELRDLGAEVRSFMPVTAHVVRMDAETAAEVAKLPFVRWVGPFLAADRVDPEMLEENVWPRRVHVQVFDRGPAMKGRVAADVADMGGEVVWMIDEGFRFDAMLDAGQVAALATHDDVLWMDAWSAPEEDMDKVRVDGGANYVEVAGGFKGQGVRAEAMDGNVNENHPDLQSNPVIFHGPRSGSNSHGTPVTGIVFGDGAGNPARRGIMPDAQPIFGDYGQLNNRYTHTAELLQAPYNAVFQTNSWGSSRTTQYTSISMEMDDILFQNDIVILQSQSNAGNQDSRPQAWAKNIVAVGGIRHQDTQSLADDAWSFGASIGPAADGRLKPDLSYWYDSILTTGGSGGNTSFGGTSAATPMTAGYFGIFFQMWHEGVFGNGFAGTVFESAPKATLTRAFMINTADRYAFSGASSDLRRTTQGWGRADVENLYDERDEFFWVNEEYVLEETEAIIFPVEVEPNTAELAVTMVYLDRAGTTAASQHRINDLSLRVTAPNGTTSYWGNNGLTSGNLSSAGGSSNTLDVVENVFLDNPTPGTWQIEVIADDINQDTHVETPELDADFALVVRGTSTSNPDPCIPPQIYCPGAPNSVTPFGAQLILTGSNSVAANDLGFSGFGFPPSTFGLVARSQLSANAPLGQGVICIDNPLIRMSIIQADNLGTLSYQVDASAAAPGGPVLVGETWHYQVWYRDGQDSNLSDAFRVTWCE